MVADAAVAVVLVVVLEEGVGEGPGVGQRAEPAGKGRTVLEAAVLKPASE